MGGVFLQHSLNYFCLCGIFILLNFSMVLPVDDDDDDDVYYYIRWRLELEGETENTGVSTKV